MGIFGAWLATAIGEAFAVLIMTSHFFRRHNTLRLDLPLAPVLFSRKIVEVGFSVFLIDIAMGVLTVLFNRQILKYLGTDELAVYGVIVMVGTFVQCCGYGVGQAAQPPLFGGAALWWAIPLAEAAVAVYAILSLMRLNRRGSGI